MSSALKPRLGGRGDLKLTKKTSDLEGGAVSSKAPPRCISLGASSAVFYAVTSIVLITSNKLTLTTYGFQWSNTLALAQFAVTCFALGILALTDVIEIAAPTMAVARVALPLTALFLADVLSGLAATSAISLPMFTVLRRFSIPCTMLLERAVGQSRPSSAVVASVVGMVLGAVIAALDDLAFEPRAYALILLNDFLTAARGVYVKSALPSAAATPHENSLKPKHLSKLSLLFYNALFSSMILAPYLAYTGELSRSLEWVESRTQSRPLASLLLSSCLGPVLQYAIFLCTQHNSALTTTVVGALKNVSTAYFGMFIGGDYQHSHLNFIGISFSCVASLFYSYATFFKGSRPPPDNPAPSSEATSSSSSQLEPLVPRRNNSSNDDDDLDSSK